MEGSLNFNESNIGKGSFGIVKLVKEKKSGLLFAMKIVEYFFF